MSDGTWDALADQFADDAYSSAKGLVRTYVMHAQLMDHLPAAPATVLDVGGGAGHQSFPLAAAGYRVTLLEPSGGMLDKARARLTRLPADVQDRVTLVQADAAGAADAVDGQRFDAVLCHGVLGYQEDPAPIVDAVCRRVSPGGIVSIMAGNVRASAVRPAMERRWADALAAFDSSSEVGVLGVRTWALDVDRVSGLLGSHGIDPIRWYGVWLFVDWLEFAGVELDPTDSEQVRQIAAVELEAARRDPYRGMSRVFHLIGRRPSGHSCQPVLPPVGHHVAERGDGVTELPVRQVRRRPQPQVRPAEVAPDAAVGQSTVD